ncbi:MAG TPA: GNAT family N-acetyltransferase [Burkholderiaceae bacterium]|nr:GNAT family N-acetyltransferase [Burkholderiaceae bacterium]
MKRASAAVDYDWTSKPIDERMAHQSIDPDGITISCYENDVPSFVADDMERLYENIFSSLAQYRIYNDVLDTSTYIVRKGGQVVTVFLFRCERATVRVLNEVIRVDEEDVARFACYVFSRFPDIALITFKAVHADFRKLPLPYQRFNLLEDIVLALPESAEAYLEKLGKSMRRNIKRHAKKLGENNPSFQYKVYAKDEIDARMVQEIVNLNHARMTGKNKISAFDQAETERIFRLSKICGLVGIVVIDGRICAGAISYRAGSNYFLNVIAHDPQYDAYLLGILCCYFTICECIDRGGKEFHFLWGKYDYKFALLGVERELDTLTVYRSRARMLLNTDKILYAEFKNFLRKSLLWLRNVMHRNDRMSRIAFAPLKYLKSMKWSHSPSRRK